MFLHNFVVFQLIKKWFITACRQTSIFKVNSFHPEEYANILPGVFSKEVCVSWLFDFNRFLFSFSHSVCPVYPDTAI